MEMTVELPEELAVRLRPSDPLQHRMHMLLEKNRNEGLTPAEEQEWARYEYIEHLIRMAKVHAALKQKNE